MTEKKSLKTGLHARGREITVAIPVPQADRSSGGAAEFNGRGDQGVEHGLQIEGRAADDLEHVGGGSLLVQCLRKVAGSRLNFGEHPHVLNRDHGLIGEGLDESDLALRERTWFGAGEYQRAFHL